MGQAGDDRFVDSQAHSDEADSGNRGSFDPGLETGYLRRAPREHELTPELGAAPFDPGPELYDERRASKEAKRREREARRRRQAELKAQETRNVVQRATGGRAQAAALQPAFDPERVPAPDPVPAPQPEPSSPPASVTELRPRREPLAERLDRERVERERAERQRRAKIERERAEREGAERERRERRRRERAEKLRREREGLRPAPRPGRPTTARVEPAVRGPVRKRARAAENRMRTRTKRRGLFWPTAKAGLALTVVMALGAGLGSLLGLPVPGLDETAGNAGLVNSASLFGIDPGTPTGLVHGYVFPLRGPHDFGDKIARFGAPRYGHIHEGQDIFGKTGTPEIAVHDGIVVDRGKNSDPDDGGRGNYVVIYSPSDNHSFVYMHMLKPSPVGLAQKVHSGDVVGQLGCTGSCEGPHLHFEVRVGKASLGADTKPLDPLPFLQQWPQSTPG
jgi:murein DD-endopeptidase MepM/ murein hydrolase activator NlpD